MKSLPPVLLIGVALLASAPASRSAEQQLEFNTSIFETLGKPDFGQLTVDLFGTTKEFQTVGIEAIEANERLFPVMSKLAKTVSRASEWSEYINTVKSAYAVGQATTVQGISREISGFFSDVSFEPVEDLRAAIRTNRLRVYGIDPPAVPRANIYTGAALDLTVRKEVVGSLPEARKALRTVTSVRNDMIEARKAAVLLTETSVQASQVAFQRATALSNLLASREWITPAEVALANALAGAIQNLISSELRFNEIVGFGTDAIAEADELLRRIDRIHGSVADSIAVLELAQSIPLAVATYNVKPLTGKIVKPDYSLSFTGESFTGLGIELPTSFKAGVLSVFNGPDGREGVNRHPFSLQLERKLVVRGIGSWSASANAELALDYLTRKNVEDDPAASADYLYFAGTSKGAGILEDNLVFFDVMGGVNSPFKIVDFDIAPESRDSAFIVHGSVSAIPEAGVTPMMFAGLGLLALATRSRFRNRQAS